ncbi:MAG: GNAT family N-acetyltransferase [Desulforhopalus sp.]|nr:GNAT family N-acetyltransferase [Desulforhopalus sp.]
MALTRIQLITDSAFAVEAGKFFSANVDLTYISHGEIIDGRAESFLSWSPQLESIFAADAKEAIGNAHTPGAEGLHLAALFIDETLVGLALFEYLSRRSARTVILQDIVIGKAHRGKRLGDQFLGWLENQFAAIGHVNRIFLESGHGNTGAHSFFERHGYTVSSIVMTKQMTR